jgi:hypothetical protein
LWHQVMTCWVSVHVQQEISLFLQVRDQSRPIQSEQVHLPTLTNEDTLELLKESFQLPDKESVVKLLDGTQQVASARQAPSKDQL